MSHKAQVNKGYSANYTDENGVDRLANAGEKITIRDTKQFETLKSMGAVKGLDEEKAVEVKQDKAR